MTRLIIATCGLALATSAMAQETRSVVASEAGTIQIAGPRGGDGGNRYFNIEGMAFEPQFRSYGVARWDLSAIRSEFDSLFPTGWEVTQLALELTQDNSGFTTDGFVDVYLSSDDSADIKTALSDLAYPFFDPDTLAPDLDLVDDFPILSFFFFELATGTIDRFDQDGGPGGSSEALDLTTELASDIETDDELTLVFVDASEGVAATYRGQEEFMGREGPKLFITVAGDTTGGCRADLDGDGSLTIFDFLQFQNLFDAGDPAADFDGDGSLTIFDFLAFQNEFDLGC